MQRRSRRLRKSNELLHPTGHANDDSARPVAPVRVSRLVSGMFNGGGDAMGVWGAGNFANDAALDFVANAVVEPMTAQLRKVVENPALADPEEYSSEVLAAVEILAVICEGINAHPSPSQLVEDCRDVCLRGWDEGIDKLHPKPGFKEERRAVIAATFERLLKVCRHWESL
jgi:hypothetical protein